MKLAVPLSEHRFGGNPERGSPLCETGGLVKILVLAPSDYRTMGPNLGIATLYRWAASHADLLVDRGYLFWPGGGAGVARRSVERGIDYFRFDLIALSIPFELDYVHLPPILAAVGIPVAREGRGNRFPLILAGGRAVGINPWPLLDIVDGALLGDGEELFPEFIRFFKENRHSLNHEELVSAFAAARPGVVFSGTLANKVPPTPVKFHHLDARPAYSLVTSEKMEFPGKFLVEVERGCPYLCTFCTEGYNTRQFNRVGAKRILSLIETHALSARLPVGLVGSAVLNHPEIPEVIDFLDRHQLPFSLSSLRAEKVKPWLLEKLARTGQKGITLAPETASTRLKRWIRKETPNELFFEIVRQATAVGLRHFKFYFIFGFPGESREETLEIVDFARGVIAATGSGATVTMAINLFVPKPGTPLGDGDFIGEEEARWRGRALKKELGRMAGVECDLDGYRMALFQFLFSTGGARLARLLRDMDPRRFSPGDMVRYLADYAEREHPGDRMGRAALGNTFLPRMGY